jgi:hypothetical protein
LDTINSVQGASLDQLERQLEESKNILGKMNQNLQGDILQNLIEIAMACDEDGDSQLNDEEIESVIIKLENLNGVEIDNERIRDLIIQNGRQLEGTFVYSI